MKPGFIYILVGQIICNFFCQAIESRNFHTLTNFTFQFFIKVVKFQFAIIWFKGNAQFLFLCNLQKSLIIVCLMKIIKKHCHKKQ